MSKVDESQKYGEARARFADQMDSIAVIADYMAKEARDVERNPNLDDRLDSALMQLFHELHSASFILGASSAIRKFGVK